MSYPKIISEDETVDLALAGRSLARYGDGELKIILGGDCVSQVREKQLAKELAEILKETGPVLPCIPNAMKSIKPAWRDNYATPRYTNLYRNVEYGSSFITRPDSAPWIDRVDYWAKIKRFWEDRDITLVLGTVRSLRPNELPGVKSIREVWGPRRDAYAEIDRIEEEIGKPSGPVLICLGPTATVLASRLAKKGVWALDLGHLGMFMRHAGMYAFQKNDLYSPEYQQQLYKLHSNGKRWGTDGQKYADIVEQLAKEFNAETTLDYGCGEQTLSLALKGKIRVQGYDPGIIGREGMPKPCDLVVCTDVLEHIEPSKLENVLKHIYFVTEKAAFFVISTRKAKAILPDGRNAHLIVENSVWWEEKLKNIGWQITQVDINESSSLVSFWLKK